MRADKRLWRVVVAHRHRGLQHDRTAVELRGDQVHGGAGDPDAVLECLPLGIDAGERRQERRVHVEDAVGKRLEQRRAHQPHEARETDEPDVTRGEPLATARSKASRLANAR